MRLYSRFCDEVLDQAGVLQDVTLHYPDNYNFGYDIVDEMARLAPQQRAMVRCNPKGEHWEFTSQDIGILSNQAAHITAAIGTPDGSVINHLLQAQKICPELETVFAVRKSVEATVDFTQKMEIAPKTLARIDTKVTDPMLIYFTSGITGYSTAVIHDHTYTLSHIITARYWQDVQKNGLHLTVAGTGWGNASWEKICGQWLCGCAVMVYDFDLFSPSSLLRIILKYQVTSFCAPPTVYRYFVKSGNMVSYKWISLLGFVEEMLKTISGKIRRVELREERV